MLSNLFMMRLFDSCWIQSLKSEKKKKIQSNGKFSFGPRVTRRIFQLQYFLDPLPVSLPTFEVKGQELCFLDLAQTKREVLEERRASVLKLTLHFLLFPRLASIVSFSLSLGSSTSVALRTEEPTAELGFDFQQQQLL